MGAWIETLLLLSNKLIRKPRPTWARGLKQALVDMRFRPRAAPHVGAWIETALGVGYSGVSGAAPHVGAWIETRLPLECSYLSIAAPHVGAWIET